MEKQMNKTIFISLPVSNLNTAIRFYEALGFVRNLQFSDESTAGMGWSEHIKVMLITHEKWRTFTNRPIPPSTFSEVGLSVSVESREQVDRMNEAAAANGGTGDINPVQDHGFMYCRDMADPDGHIWGAMWMDQSAMTSSS